MRASRSICVGLGVVAMLGLCGTPAAADARATVVQFTFTDHFVIEPGDAASCSFPITADVVGRGTYQVLFDSSGSPVRVIVHSSWQGTLSANDKTDVEYAAQTDIFDLADGTSTNVGSIHDLAFGQGVVIHDVGILRFNADGTLAFEAGPHQGFEGDPAAIESLCASLS